MMRIKIQLTGDSGVELYSGEMALSQSNSPKQPHKAVAVKTQSPNYDYKLPIKAFMNQNGRSVSSHSKLALLIAYMSNGSPESVVKTSEVIKKWNGMQGIVGSKFYSV